MTKIQEIAEAANLGDPKSMDAVAARLKTVSEHELHFYLVMRDTLNATSAETRKGIALAQFEADRRARNETRRLAIITTAVSGILALLGVALGAYLSQPNLTQTCACPKAPVITNTSSTTPRPNAPTRKP
jgi:hypothetical protein